MLPCNPGGHAAFQDTFVSQFLKFYPGPFVLPKKHLGLYRAVLVSRSFQDCFYHEAMLLCFRPRTNTLPKCCAPIYLL